MATVAEIQRDLEIGKARRKRRESILAYLFVAPATIITFIFGIWPVIFGFFVSLHQWRARSHNFLGLNQYVRALGNAAYVLAFFICLLFLYRGYQVLLRTLARMREGKGNFYPYLLPGLVLSVGTILFAAGFAAQDQTWMLQGLVLLAVGGVINWVVARQVTVGLDANYTQSAWQVNLFGLLGIGLFVFTVSELLNDSAVPLAIVQELLPDMPLLPMSHQMLAAGFVLLAGLLVYALRWWGDRLPDDYEYDRVRLAFRIGTIVLGVVVLALVLYLITAMQYDNAAAAAIREVDRDLVSETGQAITGLERSDFRKEFGTLRPEDLANYLISWPQVISIALGFFLMFSAYRVWRAASSRETGLGATTFVLLSILIAVGGWLLIGELPQAMSIGDTDYFNSLMITTSYALGTVPFQLGLGVFLAYIMFYEIGIGKSFFRMLYFMPYVAPTVATATVFGIIFSSRPFSLANQAVGMLGIESQSWLFESKGVFQIIAEMVTGPDASLPSFLAGPSLALVSIIVYNIWVFAGYNAVIFLAGLGAIPGDLFEAAKVDGAGRWAAFRKITFPLLSPTTFFLTVLGITGTFRAFSHIYVMRQAAARGTADTASVHIFVQFWQFNQWGYASAMAFVLFGVILMLTLVQNEVSKGRVFYG